jgi:hypothetical protein
MSVLFETTLQAGEHRSVEIPLDPRDSGHGVDGYLIVSLVTEQGVPLATPDVWLEQGGRTIKPHFRILFVLLMSSLGQALEFAGGSGDPNDPYQIATADQLMAMGEDPNLLDRCCVLVNDIDLDPNLSGAREFDRAVIAPGESAFAGVFDGNDHTIYHLTVIGDSYLGLFGQVDREGEVFTLNLEDVVVRCSGETVGGLVGENNGWITGCSCRGDISGAHTVGALAGTCAGEILGVHSTGYVYGGRMGSRNVGGLVGGLDSGTVIDCWSAADVNGPSRLGGLLGYTSDGLVTRCFSIGGVSGRVSIGGFIGNGTTWQSRHLCIGPGSHSYDPRLPRSPEAPSQRQCGPVSLITTSTFVPVRSM